MKCIFSITPVGNLEKSWKCFSLRNTHRTLSAEAPDAGPERPAVVQVCTGRTGVSPVLSVRCEGFLQPSLRTSPVSTGPFGAQRPVVLCRRACAVAVGGNSRVQTASDTWRSAEHRTLGVERPVAP